MDQHILMKIKMKQECTYGMDWQQKGIRFGLENWIIDSQKMYKITDNVGKFIKETEKVESGFWHPEWKFLLR